MLHITSSHFIRNADQKDPLVESWKSLCGETEQTNRKKKILTLSGISRKVQVVPSQGHRSNCSFHLWSRSRLTTAPPHTMMRADDIVVDTWPLACSFWMTPEYTAASEAPQAGSTMKRWSSVHSHGLCQWKDYNACLACLTGREREKERESVCLYVCECVCTCTYVCAYERMYVCVCVCVCVRERERERESLYVCEYVCTCTYVCVCVC